MSEEKEKNDMIKLTTKKGTIKATIMGEATDVAVEIAHTAVDLVEHLIGVNKEFGYACGWTIIEALEKILPERPDMGEKKEDEDGQNAEG